MRSGSASPCAGARARARPWLPFAALLGLAILDHSLFNASVRFGAVPVPDILMGLYAVWGAGAEALPLLVVLLALALVLDRRALASAAPVLPALPGAPAWGRGRSAGEDSLGVGGAGEHAGATGSGPAAPTHAPPLLEEDQGRRLAAALERGARELAAALASFAGELYALALAAGVGRAQYFAALVLVRERRALGFTLALAEAAGGESPQADARELAARARRLARALAVAGAVALALLLGAGLALTGAAGVEGGGFFAGLLESLGQWWGSLSLAEQLLVTLALGALLTLSLGSFGLGMGLAFWGGTVATHGEDLAELLRDPRRKVRELARELGPTEVAAIVVQELIGRGIGRMLRRGSEAVRRRFGEKAEDVPPRSAKEAEAEARELDELAYDPHRGRVDERTLREAEVGLALRDRAELPAPLRRPDRKRGESGDIVDGNEQQWDVKSFQSREALEQGIRAEARAKGLPEPQLGPHIRGEFDLTKAMANVERSVSSQEKVILDTENLNADQVLQLREEIEARGLGRTVMWYP